MSGKLTSHQVGILDCLAGLEPRWTLTGGGALAGFHTSHRTTRDLDLFWHDLREITWEGREVRARLERGGFEVQRLQTASSFQRLRVSREGEVTIVDLVADPVPVIEEPVEARPGVLVDTPHEILVNKLNALVSRSEVRDLEDVRVLLQAGGDLGRALSDAPLKDGGFSAITLAWTLRQLSLHASADLGFELAVLESFRSELLDRLVLRSTTEG